MNLSVAISYALTCEVVNGRGPKTYEVRDAIEIEIPDLSDSDAPEVIRGHFDLRGYVTRPFSRRLHEAALYESTGRSLRDLSRWYCGSPRESADFMRKHFHSRIEMYNRGTVDKPPGRIRSVISSSRSRIEAQVREMFGSLIAIDGIVYQPAMPPTLPIILRGRDFLPLEDEGRDPVIDIGQVEGRDCDGICFNFDAGRQDRAQAFAEHAKQLVPGSTVCKNREVVLERYDVPPSLNEARRATYAVLNGLSTYYWEAHSAVVRSGKSSCLKDVCGEISQIGRSVLLHGNDPEEALLRARKYLRPLDQIPRLSAPFGALFSLAEFAIAHSPHDLALLSVDEPGLAHLCP